MWTLDIPGPLPGLNEIIEACQLEASRRSRRKGFWMGGTYQELKKNWAERLRELCEAQQRPILTGGNHFTYLIREPDSRRDPSNVIAGAIKMIEDGLQVAGYLENDGRKQVAGIRPHVITHAVDPGVFLIVDESECFSLIGAGYLWDCWKVGAR